MNKLYEIMHSYFSNFILLVPKTFTEKVGADKMGHFFAGLHVSILALISFFLFSTNLWWIVAAPVIVGVAKELLDYILNRIEISKGKQPSHGVELLDAVATAYGCIPVVLVLEIYVLIYIACFFI